jgi:hypothetical protein
MMLLLLGVGSKKGGRAATQVLGPRVHHFAVYRGRYTAIFGVTGPAW